MQRLITGLIIGAAWLSLILHAPPLLFGLAVCLLAALALAEYGRMFHLRAFEAGLSPLLIALALLPAAGAAAGGGPAWMMAGLVAGLLGIALLAVLAYQRLLEPARFLAIGGFSLLYPSLLAAHLALLIHLPEGRAWLVLLMVVTIGADSGAYYVGTRWGRHKLCPAVSPGKSWEGYAGGLVTALAGVLLVGWLFFPAINRLQLLGFAFILAQVGVIGDLLESILKRGAGVKDSGALLPGHGGILDRIDSLLLAAPVLYYLLLFGHGK